MRSTLTARRTPLSWGLFAIVLIARSLPATAAEPEAAKAGPTGHLYNPAVSPASPDAARSMTLIRVPAGLKLELYAAEPLLANPVAFSFDEKGRAYVVETFRLHHGVTDNRGHMNWLEADLASRTVADRVAMYRKYLGKEAETYGVEHDRIRLVEDRDGDGKADHATVFADGFNNIAAGLAAGVLARRGNVYFSCIPDLWLLRDTNGDGKADFKRSLHNGYGVHVGFLGHDLHGLTFGPDGRLYFSIGDRGLNVTAADGRILNAPDTGSVLRCEPDGSGLEIYATGLRNPQELAFDDLGNLFTVDNNSDSDDKARLVYLTEGGDSGWRMGYQYIEEPVSRGPWNAEKLWHPQFEGQAADIVPPLINLSDGPSGLVFNPGVTLLPDRYLRHFFLADFRGASGSSGVRAFDLKPKGAAFELGDSEQFLWQCLSTDVDFGPDGALYISDWVEGWDLTGKGRIYKLTDPASPHAAAAREVKTLLAAGFDQRPLNELIRLLAHADRRVRQEAQFSLALHAEKAIPLLQQALKSADNRLSRLHAVWALGQIARAVPSAALASLKPIIEVSTDRDLEIRAQAAKTLGDARFAPAFDSLIVLLKDPDLRVRSLAAIALGKLGRKEAVKPLLTALRENADHDPFLRHAAVMGLVGSADASSLLSDSAQGSKSQRLGVLLALRRRESPLIARFLDDPDPTIVTEAARAIYDTPIDAAMPALAALAGRDKLSEPALRRVVHANTRVAGPNSAKALALLAASETAPESIRIEALRALGDWPKPPGLDRVVGLWRPISPHSAGEAAQALNPVLAGLLKGNSEPVRLVALKAAGPLPLNEAAATCYEFVADRARSSESRVEALKALDRLSSPELGKAVTLALKDDKSSLRIEAQRLLAKLSPAEALPLLANVLEKGDIREKQGAFATLGTMPVGASDQLLATWLDRPYAKIPPEVELDLLEAAAHRDNPAVAARLKLAELSPTLDSKPPADDPVKAYRAVLLGGDASRGEKIFREKTEVSCLRCHKINDLGGEVGPPLTGIGARQDRRYLLESILAPNRQIAKGFETQVIATNDGQIQSGILKEETPDSLLLITAEGKSLTIKKSDIEEQKRGVSAMPDDVPKHLTRFELRDLVEYLATRK